MTSRGAPGATWACARGRWRNGRGQHGGAWRPVGPCAGPRPWAVAVGLLPVHGDILAPQQLHVDALALERLMEAKGGGSANAPGFAPGGNSSPSSRASSKSAVRGQVSPCAAARLTYLLTTPLESEEACAIRAWLSAPAKFRRNTSMIFLIGILTAAPYTPWFRRARLSRCPTE